MQILIKGKRKRPQWSWKSIKATHLKEPYRYETEQEARDMLNLCYPNIQTDNKRVIEIEKYN